MALHSWLARPQRRLGPLGLIVLLVITSLVTPLSLDMYTPAVPHMTEHFNTSESMVNLTLVGYFLFFAVGLLAFGPASDRYGRKPMLLAGILTYALASALCALSVDIVMLIATRILQALGAGAVSAVSTAVVKDAVVPERREALLSVVQVMFVVGPVLAPVAGALILQVADWRMTFWVLAGIGLLCAGLALLFDETLPSGERYEGTVLNLLVPYHVLQTGFLPRAITDKLHHERKPTNRPNGLIERALLDAFPRVFYSALHGERNFVILYAAEMMLTCASEKRNRSILK